MRGAEGLAEALLFPYQGAICVSIPTWGAVESHSVGRDEQGPVQRALLLELGKRDCCSFPL